MRSLSKSDVDHVAKLAFLKLTKEESAKFQKQLSEVVNYVSQLSEVETSDTEPTSQTTGLENNLRTDEVKKERSLSEAEALSGSDNTHNGYFKVSAILEERSDK